MRVQHWAKNLFVLLPLPFALSMDQVPDLLVLSLGLFGFSLLSSAVYVFNDIHDRTRDQSHPIKRLRPLAAGLVDIRGAWLVAGGSLILGLGILGFLPGAGVGGPKPWILALLYLAGNGVYTLFARSVAWLDVVFLSGFFVLRLILGCSLVLLPLNGGLLATGFSLAFALALGKRFSELSSGVPSHYRSSLLQYQEDHLRRAMGISVVFCWIGYLWSCYSMPLFVPEKWWWSGIPAGVGLYLLLDEVLVRKSGREPVEILNGARWSRYVISIWAILVFLSTRY